MEGKEKIDILSMPPEQVVTLLQKSGAKDFSMELLKSDIESGAPVNADGTINLFDYSAWLYDGRYNKGLTDEE